jgi:cyclophilin family peptidyl-prolyl cis-trans isomerase
MARPSRRRKRSSRRNLYLSVAVAVIIVVAAVGVYETEARKAVGCTQTGPYAVLDTSQGTIVMQLYPSCAPLTVANFEKLANSSFYSDLVWHRIVSGFIIQTGDPTTRDGGGNESLWGDTGSGTTIPFETNNLPNDEYYVAMANTIAGGNGASSQFFIDLANNTSLTGQYTVFGKVVQGMSVVQAIGDLPVAATCATSGELQCPPVSPLNALLISVTIQSTP